MILSGQEILERQNAREISIQPFRKASLNSNSYEIHVGDDLRLVTNDPSEPKASAKSTALPIEAGRWRLEAHQLYLVTTEEVIGGGPFVVTLVGTSSIGRAGLFVQVVADLGHTGSHHAWTLELVPLIDLYLYPGQPIGQVSFWRTRGARTEYSGFYGYSNRPLMSKEFGGEKYHDIDRFEDHLRTEFRKTLGSSVLRRRGESE